MKDATASLPTATAIFSSTTTTAPTSVTSMGAATTAAKTDVMYSANQQLPPHIAAGKCFTQLGIHNAESI